MNKLSYKGQGFIFLYAACCTLLLVSSSSAAVETQQKTQVSDNIIGSTFKVLAKTFVSTVDIEKIKKVNIEKIRKMDEAKFRRRYLAVFNIINDCPPLRDCCGLSLASTKDEVIKKIGSLDKKKACQLFDSMPNAFIARHFRFYLAGKKQGVQKNNITVQVRQLWDRIAGRVCEIRR